MKNTRWTRLVCVVLVALMALCLLAACNEDTPNPPEQGGTTPPPQGENQFGLPDYLMTVTPENYGGEEIVILCREDKAYEIDGGEDASSLMEKASFNRNARVEEYLDVDIISHPVPGSWPLRAQFIEILANAVSTTDNSFQLTATHGNYMAGLTLNDQFWDIMTVEDKIDLDAEWWSQSWIENATINNKLYFVTGDVSLTMWEGLYAVFFNRQMANDRYDEIGDLYQLVRDEEWTLAELAMLSDLYIDDGNDVRDAGDTYGLIMNRHSMRTFITSCDLPIAERNEEGGFDLVFMDEDHAEKVTTVYAALYDLIYKNDGTWDSKLQDGDYTEMLQMFTAEDGALFMTGTLENANQLRQAKMEFGILPFPKYDIDQETYLAHSYDGLSAFGIPACALDPAIGAKVLDAMGAESKFSVVPAYHEVVLDGRIAQDADSKEMLSIIRKNLYFDFGFIYSDAIKGGSAAGPFAFFGDELRAGRESISSGWASAYEIYTTKLGELLDKFMD